MTILTYYVVVDSDVKRKYHIYNTGERQIDFYIQAYLNSPDGWSQDGYIFEPTNKSNAKIIIRISSTETITNVCGLAGDLSCAELHGKNVYLNALRWFHGAPESKLELEDYRQYMVSHEIGHILGKEHVKCPHKGAHAPVMLQQTKGIGECIPNTNVKG